MGDNRTPGYMKPREDTNGDVYVSTTEPVDSTTLTEGFIKAPEVWYNTVIIYNDISLYRGWGGAQEVRTCFSSSNYLLWGI